MKVLTKDGHVFEVIKETEDSYQIKAKREYFEDGTPTNIYDWFVKKAWVKEVIEDERK